MIMIMKCAGRKAKQMSNLKKDIENVFLQYRAELKQGLNELAGHGTPEEQSATQIINLIESVIPEEDEHTWRAYGQPDGTVVCDHCNVADDVNNLLLSQVADIKSKLIGKDK